MLSLYINLFPNLYLSCSTFFTLKKNFHRKVTCNTRIMETVLFLPINQISSKSMIAPPNLNGKTFHCNLINPSSINFSPQLLQNHHTLQRAKKNFIVESSHRHKKALHNRIPHSKLNPKNISNNEDSKNQVKNGSSEKEEEHIFLEEERKAAWHDSLTGPVFWVFRTIGTVID